MGWLQVRVGEGPAFGSTGSEKSSIAWASAVVSVVSRGVARDVDSVQIEVAPYQWNPVTGVLRVHDRIDFRLDYPTLD